VEQPKDIKHIVILILLSFLSLAFVQAASGCSKNQISTTGGSSASTELDPVPLNSDSLQQFVTTSMGEMNSLRSAAIAGDGTERVVSIGVDRSTTCEDGSVEAVMAVLSQKVMPGLFEYPEVAQVTITMYGVKQGVRSDDVAAEVNVTRASAQEIDWSLFGPMTMSSMVTKYYLDPAILQNSYNGGGITGGIHG
jgi:hypothetical protein